MIHLPALPDGVSRGSWMVPLALLASVATATAVAVGGPVAGLMLLLGSALAAVTVYMPGLLFAMFLLSGIYKGAIQPLSPVDITVVLAALNAFQAVPLVLRHEPARFSRAGVALMGAVGFLYLGGLLYAPSLDLALRSAATYWAFVLLAIVPAAARVGSEPRFIRQFLWAMFALGVPMVVVGLLQMSGVQRLRAFDASTIEVSRAALLVPIVGTTFVLRERNFPMRALAAILIPAAIVVAVASGSRGPLVALLVIASVGAIRWVWRPALVNWRVVGTVAVVIIASFVALSVVGDALPTLATSRYGLFGDFLARLLNGSLDSTLADTSSGRRLDLFGAALTMFQERPLLGFGTAGFAAVSPGLTGPPYEAWPHNAVLQFAAEFGLVGVFLFIGVVGVTLLRRLPDGHAGTAVRVAFAFFLLNTMVSDDIYGSKPTWGLMALVLLIDVPRASKAIARRLVPGAAAADPDQGVVTSYPGHPPAAAGGDPSEGSPGGR